MPQRISLKINFTDSSPTSPQPENFDETEIVDESEAKINFRDSIKRMKRDTVTKKPCDFGNIIISNYQTSKIYPDNKNIANSMPRGRSKLRNSFGNENELKRMPKTFYQSVVTRRHTVKNLIGDQKVKKNDG